MQLEDVSDLKGLELGLVTARIPAAPAGGALPWCNEISTGSASRRRSGSRLGPAVNLGNEGGFPLGLMALVIHLSHRSSFRGNRTFRIGSRNPPRRRIAVRSSAVTDRAPATERPAEGRCSPCNEGGSHGFLSDESAGLV